MQALYNVDFSSWLSWGNLTLLIWIWSVKLKVAIKILFLIKILVVFSSLKVIKFKKQNTVVTSSKIWTKILENIFVLFCWQKWKQGDMLLRFNDLYPFTKKNHWNCSLTYTCSPGSSNNDAPESNQVTYALKTTIYHFSFLKLTTKVTLNYLTFCWYLSDFSRIFSMRIVLSRQHIFQSLRF